MDDDDNNMTQCSFKYKVWIIADALYFCPASGQDKVNF